MKDNRPHHDSYTAESSTDIARLLLHRWAIVGWWEYKPGVISLTMTRARTQETLLVDTALLREMRWLRPVRSAKRRRALRRKGMLLAPVALDGGYTKETCWLRISPLWWMA